MGDTAIVTTEDVRVLQLFTGYGHALYHVVYATKAFFEGIEICQVAFKILNECKNRLNQEQYNTHLMDICSHFLMFLDLSDQWDAYLESYDEIFENIKIYIPIGQDNFDSGRHRLRNSATYYKEHKGSYVYVHFLWRQATRRELLFRKLEKLRKGGKIGNMLHKQQNSLTQDEILERYNRVMSWIRYPQSTSSS